MNWWRRWRNRDQLEAELDAELRDHVARQMADQLRDGVPPGEARRQVRARFGGVDQVKEQCRDARGTRWADELWQDLRYAVRTLATHRSFAAVALLALALGIGINNAMLTIYLAHAVRGLPIEAADRVAWVSSRDDRNRPSGMSHLDFRDIEAEAQSYTSLAAFLSGPVVVGDPGQPPGRFQGAHVSTSTFDLIGETPILGRTFTPEDEAPSAEPTVVLGGGIWRARYAADPAVVGRAILVGGRSATVIGVMPDRLRFPGDTDLWQPLSLHPDIAQDARDHRPLGMIGRLASNVTVAQAQSELATIGARLARQHRGTNANTTLVAKPINDRFNNDAPVWDIFARVGFVVLLIACANVANLLLLRAVSRAREIAMRTTLGASRWRVIRQLLVESSLLAVAGGLGGLLLSRLFIAAFEQVLPEGYPYWIEYSIDVRGFAALCAVCLGSVFVFGLAPAILCTRPHTRQTLDGGGRASTGGRSNRRLTGTLQAFQFGLATIFCATVFGQMEAVRTLERRALTVDADDLFTMWVAIPEATYPTPEDRSRLWTRLTDALGELALVETVAVSSALPFDTDGTTARPVETVGGRADNPEAPAVARVMTVGPGYFSTIGAGLQRGRDLRLDDGQPESARVIVDQRFVDVHFPGTDGIGQRLRTVDGASEADSPWSTIVGVSPAIGQQARELPDPVVYQPLASAPPTNAALIIRSRAELTIAADAVRERLRALDPDLPTFRVETMAAALENSRWNPVVSMMILTVIALSALGVAAVGLYAVTAHGVAQQMREIGVRMALGAQSRQIRWLVLRRVLIQVAFGIVAGLGLAAVSPMDTAGQLTWGAATVVCVALVAAWNPVRRATRLDPATVLRWE